MSICAPAYHCSECGRHSGDRSRCGNCRDGERARRDERQAQGQCGRCGAPVEHLGGRRCARCADLERKANRHRTADDQAAGICIGCRQRKRAPTSKWRCEACLMANREASAAAAAKRAEQKRQDVADGNMMLRQTLEYLAAEGIEPPADLVAHARARGVQC